MRSCLKEGMNDMMENKNNQVPSNELTDEAKSAHPLTAESLTEEQIDHLMARLTELKKQKTEQQTEDSTAIPATDSDANASAEAPTTENAASEEERESDLSPVIVPDPNCFDELGDAPENGTVSGIASEDDLNTRIYKIAEKTSVEISLSSDLRDEDDSTAIDAYRELVQRKKKQRQLIVALIVAFGVLLFLIILIIGLLRFYRPDVDDTPPFAMPSDTVSQSDTADHTGGMDSPPDDGVLPPVISDSYQRKEDVYNFLVLGIDRAANLSDVIMIVSYDVKNGSISVLSVPRDTYINVGANYHKLNAYFAASYNHSSERGEARYRDAIASMSAFLEVGLCIQIDRYICMDIAGFREIVDTIGGVYLDVPFDMYYEDPEQNLYIDLDAGYQHLDGEKAEMFVRFRKSYLNGDLGRISAQKLFLTALVKQVQRNLDLSTVVSLAKTAVDYVTTDLSVAEIGYFAKNAFSVDMDKIQFTTLPGGGAENPDSGASYYVIYAESVRNIVNAQFNVYERDISRDVFLLNSKKFTSDDPYISKIFLAENIISDSQSAQDIEDHSIEIPTR